MANNEEQSFVSLGQDDTPLSINKTVIVFLDVDCFEYQVWVKKNYRGQQGQIDPAIVINSHGVILSVNNEAKELGITRKMGREDAQQECLRKTQKHLSILKAGLRNGLVDDQTPLEESDKILRVLRDHRSSFENKNEFIIEKSSIDEFYIDVTNLVNNRMQVQDLPDLEVITGLARRSKQFSKEINPGNPMLIFEDIYEKLHGQELIDRICTNDKSFESDWNEIRLFDGALIAHELMETILEKTGYEVSFGIGNNKLTAKVACGLNKPQGITIIPRTSGQLLQKLKFENVPGFHGRIGGLLCAEFNLNTLFDLLKIGKESLERKLSWIVEVQNPQATALELYNKAQLMDSSIVQKKYFNDSMAKTISFKGFRTAHVWADVVEGCENVSKAFVNKLEYQYFTHRRRATAISVSVLLTKQRGDNCGCNSWKNCIRLPTSEEMKCFVLKYIEDNNHRPGELLEIKLTAKGFVKVDRDLIVKSVSLVMYL